MARVRVSGRRALVAVCFVLFIGGVLLMTQDDSSLFEATATAFAVRFAVQEISSAELAARLAAGRPTLLLDVREEAEQSVSRIPGSRLLNPRALLEADEEVRRFAEAHAANPDALIVAYCAGGYRSARSLARAAKALNRPSVPARNLHGGIVAYANEGGPLVTPAGESTDVVHAYNEMWARFVRPPIRATVEPPVE